MRLAAEKFPHGAANQRSTRSAADKNDFIHVRGLELGVGKGLFDRASGAVDHGANESIERAAREFVNEHFSAWQRKTKSGGLLLGELMLHIDQRFAKLLG